MAKEKETKTEIHPVVSSNIVQFSYEPENKVLYSLMKNTVEYRYENVSRKELDTILNSESVGAKFNELIVKGGKTCTRL